MAMYDKIATKVYNHYLIRTRRDSSSDLLSALKMIFIYFIFNRALIDMFS